MILELGRYGIMLSRQQIGIYYNEVEKYMQKFVDEHLNSDDYIETDLDYMCDFSRIQNKRLNIKNRLLSVLT